MDLFIVIANRNSGNLIKPLAEALTRKDMTWSMFFTGNGVYALENQDCILAAHLANEAVACEESWTSTYSEKTCPVQLGSQLNNSMMVGKAKKVLSI